MNVRVLRGRGSLRLILGITALAFALTGCAHDVARAGTSSRPATSTQSFSAYDSTGQPGRAGRDAGDGQLLDEQRRGTGP